MAKIKLSLKKLTFSETVDLARLIHTKMTGNASFPTPTPTLTELASRTNAAENSQALAEAARATAIQRTSERDAAFDSLRTVLTGLAGYVDAISRGDETIIASAGMDLRSDAAPTIVIQVTGLAASAGDDEGEVDLSWDSQRDARSYEVQISVDPITAGSWRPGTIVSKSKCTLTGLPSGARCWFRVRAIGANDQKGPWSDPAVKTVP